ncbi:protein MIS12 homolog [Silene latifolia]|uniref:protein MIS12 homolog n=1 Tax=Silene latifolia TaxID=37657 RepID=UPI003D773C64
MEGSESEEVFEEFNLKPQFFVNEALDHVDDLIEGAFDHFHQEALKLLNTDGTDRSEDIKSGVNYVRNTVQASLDKRLLLWQQFCLRQCFAVPSGFTLPPENEASGDDAMDQDDLSDEQMDAQLDSLRSKLAEAGKECSQLDQELKQLETSSALANRCASAVNEALQLYDNSSAQEVFQELLRVGSELRQKMDQLKTKQKEDAEHNGPIANGGLSNLKSDTLQEFIAEMNF